MNDQVTQSGWITFWNRGGWWRAALAAAVYLALYLGAGAVSDALFGDRIDTKNLFGTAPSVFFALTVPLIVGAIVLVVFIVSLGWFPVLFSRQPVRGSRWMWIAPVLVVIAVILRLLGIDYGGYHGSVIVLTFATGLLVGFVEEVLTRGLVVKMLRDAGKSEWVVMAVSSLIFGLLHATNLFSGQPVLTVLLTVVFTIGFGVCMYLTLRVTGNLIWPILIHGLYDPTLFLASGGIDQAGTGAQSPFLAFAAPFNFFFIAVAIVALIVLRGRSGRAKAEARR
jgi:membrane protease YdiL (CAAX protease family)